MQGINIAKGNTSSLQPRSIEQNRTNPQSAAVATNTQSPPPPVAAEAPLAPPTTRATSAAAGEEEAAAVGVKEPKGDPGTPSGYTDGAKDAALRAQLIPVGVSPTQETAAVGVEESKGDDQAHTDIFSILPQAVVTHVSPFLDIDSLVNFAHTSETSKNYAIKSTIIQLQCLNEELNQLITDSGIAGIQIPDGQFKNPTHELRVLTAFKDALPNAITVLKAKGITDINEEDFMERTPLLIAASHGHTEAARALIELGADVNLWDDSGWTPLHWAAFNGHTDVVKILINAGADVKLTNYDEESPLKWAAFKRHTDIVSLLEAAAAAGSVEESKGD